MSERTIMRSFLFLCAVPFVVACGDDGEPEAPPTGTTPAAVCGEPASDYVITASSEDHSCSHVTGGPFGDVAAAAASDAEAPNLDNEHMLYTVTLPADGDQFAGWVTFRPSFDATYILNLGDDVPIEVTAADDGSSTCNAATQALDDCDGLLRAEMFTIEGQRFYRVDIGPSATETVTMLVEEHIKPRN